MANPPPPSGPVLHPPGSLSHMTGTGDHTAAAAHPENISDPCGYVAALGVLSEVPKGALSVVLVAVALLLGGWLLTFFLLFLPRGYIG